MLGIFRKMISKGYFSPAIETEQKKSSRNPKRLQREVKKQLQMVGIGTKSQRALQLQREEMKTERKQISKEQKEADKNRGHDRIRC